MSSYGSEVLIISVSEQLGGPPAVTVAKRDKCQPLSVAIWLKILIAGLAQLFQSSFLNPHPHPHLTVCPQCTPGAQDLESRTTQHLPES